MSDNEERQESELLALNAIYPELVDLRNERNEPRKATQHNRKNVNRQPSWRPLELQITLKPNTEEVHVHCRVDLYVKCGDKYPQRAPEQLQIKNVVGLSNVAVEQLEGELVELANELAEKDEESLFMCINKVEDFLNEHNKPAPKSFYDQMLSNKLKQQEEEERLKMELIKREKQKEKELNRVLKEAMDEKQKLLENENRKRRASFLEDEITSSINSLENSISNLKEQFLSNLFECPLNEPASSSRSCSQDHPLLDLKFKTVTGSELHVQRYKCEFHFDAHHTDYLAIQTNRKDSTPFYLLSEWNLKLNQKSDKNQQKEEKSRIMKELTVIKSKFEHHLAHLQHPHIVQPIAFVYSLENDLISLRLLQNYAPSLRFCDLPVVLSKFQQELKSTPYYFLQILDALNHLHSNKIIHGNLTTESVLIDLGSGRVKLINALLNGYLESVRGLDTAAGRMTTGFKLKDIEQDYFRFAYLLAWFLLEFKLNFKQLLLIKQADLLKMLHEQHLDDCTLGLIRNCLNRNSITILEPLLIEFFNSSFRKLNDGLNEPLKKRAAHLADELESDQLTNNDNLKNLALAGKNSRLSDFVILSKLGKGGFGEVYKVKNILDQNEYALKKIIINTTNKLLNKKIKQEVRYLSGLCHENVVRYFSSWIEYEMDRDDRSDEDETDSFSSSKPLEKDSLYDSEDDCLTDDEVDARRLFSNSLCLPKPSQEENSSDFVVFQDSQAGDKQDDATVEEKSDLALVPVEKSRRSLNPSPYNEVMYIQMELCEKSTLQHAISSQLYLDNRRSRRLFRELIEALAYIHEKEIIHRDLISNIFLDSYDHVKIGDFGLATGYVNELLRAENQQQSATQPSTASNALAIASQSNQNSSLNVKSEIVGTPFYLSPEIQVKSADLSAKKITYTSKVDIYSSGIIFFEMCYPHPTTGMERFKILTNLRLPEVLFPNDVHLYFSDQELRLVKQLLNHNPKERPSSSELLESEYLPPLEIEEAKQQIMIKQVIQNTRSKQHKYLLNSLFNRQMNNVEDIVYDCESKVNNEQLRSRVFQYVCDRLKSIIKKYGGLNLSIPTFTPANSLSKFNLNHSFSVMDNNGCIIQAPYDLRIPFARYIARTPNLNTPTFRRFAIDKVYRSRIIGYHPKQLYECAFDIVNIQNGVQWPVLPDVEVLSVLNEIIDSFDCLKNRPFILRLNSIAFLKSVFGYFEIDEKHFDLVLRIIAESNDRNFVSKSNDLEYSKTAKDYISYMLTSNNILETNKINILTQMLLDNEKNSAKEMVELVQFYMRRKSQFRQKQAYDAALDAVRELGLVIDCLQNSCSTFRMRIKFVPSLVLNLSNCNIYSRLIFQLQYDVVKKHQVLHQILATGGRYDDLIEKFSVNFSSKTDPINEKALTFAEKRTAVGFSLEIEKIIKCVLEDEEQKDFEETGDCDLAIYADIYDDERFRLIFKDLCQIAYELRQQNLRVKLFNEKSIKSLSDLNRYCVDNLIKYLFILIKSSDQQTKNLYQLKTMIYDEERFYDKRSSSLMNCSEVIEYIRGELASGSASSFGAYSSSPFGGLNTPFGLNAMNGNFMSFESCSINYSSSASAIFTANSYNASRVQALDITPRIASATNIQFVSVEKTFEQMSKKKVLSLVGAQVSNRLNYFMNTKIEVLVSEIPFKTLKLIAYESDFEKDGFGNIPDAQWEQSVKRCAERVPKYKNQINEIVSNVLELKRRPQPPLIILLSLSDLHDLKFVIVP